MTPPADTVGLPFLPQEERLPCPPVPPGARPSRSRRWCAWGLSLLLLAAHLLPATAEAGRRPYIWVWDSEVVPEGTAELEMWYWERITDRPRDATYVWTAPILGLTDRLELALPFEWSHRQQGDKTQFDWYGAELRWRLASPDRQEAGPLTTLIRLAIHRLVRERDDARGELNLVAAYEPSDALKLTLDLGAVGTLGGTVRGTYAAGASYALSPTLRVGAESFGRLIGHDGSDWQTGFAMVGPNVGWTVGRMWLTGGALFGVTDEAPAMMPRLMWAIAW